MPYTDLGIQFFMIGEPGAPHDSKVNEVQDYRAISKNYNSKNLFVDKEFLADSSSIGALRLAGPVYWKRPSEIAKDLFNGAPPVFIENIGEPRFDIYQGHVGDCWFLCSLADITLAKECFDVVVPKDNVNGFDFGAFHFRFWRRGVWLDVVVDDRLPCYMENGKITTTIFLKVVTNEFWCALVEKAYAKLYGTYKKIDFGLPMEAMEDFSGGITDYFNIMRGIDFKVILTRSQMRRSFMAAGTAADTTTPEEKRRLTVEQLDNEGIVSSHAYSILGIQDVTEKANPKVSYTLIHLRNPWGDGTEWKGKWSDKDDASWATVTEDLRIGTPNAQGVMSRLDGDFWMEYPDFLNKFAALQVCHWSTTDRGERSIKRTELRPYSTYVTSSNWVKGAKGDIRKKADLINMPSYIVHLQHLDHDEDPVFKHAPGTCVIIVNLMYKNYNQSGIDPAIPTYGFRMLWAKGEYGEDGKLGPDFFEKARDVFNNPPGSLYTNAQVMSQHIRELTFRYELPAGTCCIIPFVEFPKGTGAPETIPYLLRIFTEGEVVCKDCKQGDETVYIPPNPEPEVEPVAPTPTEPVKPEPTKPTEPTKPVVPVKPEPGPEPTKPAAPLSKAEETFKEWAGADGLLDAAELKKVLDKLCALEVAFTGFGDQTCRSLLAGVDPNSTGKIAFEQCKTLMSTVVQWINKFKVADVNVNGYLKNNEIDEALKSVGYNLNSFTKSKLNRKYADFWGNYSLDKFILLLSDLKNSVATFNETSNNDGFALFDLNSWINAIFGL